MERQKEGDIDRELPKSSLSAKNMRPIVVLLCHFFGG